MDIEKVFHLIREMICLKLISHVNLIVLSVLLFSSVIIANGSRFAIAASVAPGNMSSTPSISSWGEDHLNAFVLGSDGSIWNNPFFNKVWHTWSHAGNSGDPGHPPGITIASAPAAVARNNMSIDVFARGSDNSIWRISYDRNTDRWSAWSHAGNSGDPGHPPGITIASAPGVTSWSSSHLDIFARGSDNNIWYNSFDAPSRWSGWQLIDQSAGVEPIYSLNLGYDSGTINTGWEWGTSQYQRSTPDRLTTVDKTSVHPPSIDPSGRNAARMTVKPGDVATDPGGNPQGARAEVVLTKKLPDRQDNLFREGDDIWYHWYTLFSTNEYPTSQDTKLWQVWTQWHQSDSFQCPPGSSGCTPAVEFNVLGSNVALRVLGHIWDAQNCFTISAGQCGYKWVTPIQKGTWHEMLLHVKWSARNNIGFMEMWVDHNRVSPGVMDKSHPFATLDTDGVVYMKQGLYRKPSITFAQTIYHDGMQVMKCPQDHNYYHTDGKCYTTPPSLS